MADRDRARAWIQLDLKALEQNVETLRALLPPGCKLMAAVKANAYGHGALPVARALQDLGLGAFCVADVPEGIALRAGGIRGRSWCWAGPMRAWRRRPGKTACS